MEQVPRNENGQTEKEQTQTNIVVCLGSDLCIDGKVDDTEESITQRLNTAMIKQEHFFLQVTGAVLFQMTEPEEPVTHYDVININTEEIMCFAFDRAKKPNPLKVV